MDTTQLLLSTAVTITTVLLIIVSVQLISLLKHLKKDHGKEAHPAVKIPEVKKEKTLKKRINLTTLLEKMKTHISHPKSSKKTFFKS
ncbi:conserved hypothetical protein [Candidatus Roizmanbacteria bacterium]|nr:conserved hypothetical protein [Candidatus Roizmanbacteria bacterium]